MFGTDPEASVRFWQAFATALLLFVLLREFVCWYFKINELVKLLREIRDAAVAGTAGVRVEQRSGFVRGAIRAFAGSDSKA